MRFVFVFMQAVLAFSVVSAFLPRVRQPIWPRPAQQLQKLYGSSDDSDGRSEARMEAMSAAGADKIAEMSVSERTKRAMLAEAVEDRIFQLQDDLEALSGGVVPEDEELRAQCVEIAEEIRASEVQYNSLVSGEPSGMLNTLENLGRPNEDTEE